MYYKNKEKVYVNTEILKCDKVLFVYSAQIFPSVFIIPISLRF